MRTKYIYCKYYPSKLYSVLFTELLQHQPAGGTVTAIYIEACRQLAHCDVVALAERKPFLKDRAASTVGVSHYIEVYLLTIVGTAKDEPCHLSV